MNYSKINYFDIANGPGIRLSLFVSGCPIHCKGCFNQEAQDFNYGELYTWETEKEIVDFYKNNPQVNGFSLLGGEPFSWEQDFGTLVHLVNTLKKVPIVLPFGFGQDILLKK